MATRKRIGALVVVDDTAVDAVRLALVVVIYIIEYPFLPIKSIVMTSR